MSLYDVSGMKRMVSNLQSEIGSLDERDGRLADQIGRLQSARRSVLEIYGDDRSFASWIETYDVGSGWEGSRREEFEQNKRDAKNSGDAYCSHVLDIIQAMSERIADLENERSSIWWERSWAYARIGALNASIYSLDNRW